MKAIVTIPSAVDSRKRSWAKALRSVDTTKANGYAFEGEWVRRGERAELDVGSLVLMYDEPGSVKNWYPLVRVARVEADGTLHEVLSYEGEVGERSWALAVRDRVADLLAEPVAAPEYDLSAIPIDELIAELKRRGAL